MDNTIEYLMKLVLATGLICLIPVTVAGAYAIINLLISKPSCDCEPNDRELDA